MNALPQPFTNSVALATTTQFLHAVAEHVITPFLYPYEKKIALVSLGEQAFGTPLQQDGRQVYIEGTNLVLRTPAGNKTHALRTLQEAANFLGVTPGLPTGIYKATTPIEPNTILEIDATASAWLANWYHFGSQLLKEFMSLTHIQGSEPLLWPEHFDIAIDTDSETRKATLGASPPDGGHAEPYLYITPWERQSEDKGFNDSAFPGASLVVSKLSSTDPVAFLVEHFNSIEPAPQIPTTGQ